MSDFAREFQRLNKAQRQAVDQIDGPVLVIAGPGTGKTQLLSLRVANILKVTDTSPENILCLTFTESGAENMRERLSRFIGQAAYDVTISTYHAFGGDLIRRFPEYFAEIRTQNPVDDLGKHQILRDIVESLSYLNPLKQARYHLGDLMVTISEVKRALLTPKDLRSIARENSTFIEQASATIQEAFDGVSKLPTNAAKSLPLFEPLVPLLEKLLPNRPAHTQFGSLAAIAVAQLRTAIDDARTNHSSKPLTKWKNTWLAKDVHNHFIFDGELENRRINALADVLKAYESALAQHGWYDFDDMIIRAITVLEKHADLRYTLQERYLYLLLDEFQDTNAAQARLVQLLTDNPVNEDRPNVLAVGDDDQAIYAFQGAQYSNMLDFYHTYRDVAVVNLTENYRSHADILHTAHNVSEQIGARLQHHFEGMQKTLTPANHKLTKARISRTEFLSDIAQYDWIAEQIAQLVKNGTPTREIAVLAPKHKQLEPLVPYLNARGIPVRYEKRENILETPIIKQLLVMSRLAVALHDGDEATANALWPEVLSFDFWNLPISAVWQVSWQVRDEGGEGASSWARILLETSVFRPTALLFVAIAGKITTETCETVLDYLSGTQPIATHEPDSPTVRSPLRAFYTNPDIQANHPELFYEALSHLTVLRAKLRDYQTTQADTLGLRDLLSLVALYEEADQPMQSTSPYNQQADAVQLMTVFKAKGLEFEHVFLPSCQDEVWGNSTHANSNKLTLPPNLAPIRHAGATEDERLRILFVAITRAKLGLHLTSFLQGYNGKATKRLKYLDEQEQADGSFHALTLPLHVQQISSNDTEPPALELLQIDWRRRHTDSVSATQLRALLAGRLKHYQLSPTHLNCFIDMEFGGPQTFFFNTLLRFPQAPTADSQFGTAIHETMEWLQHKIDAEGSLPSLAQAIHYFEVRMRAKHLTPERTSLEIERGTKALSTYLHKRGHIFRPGNKAEQNFRSEGVFVGDAHLSGKIDYLEIDRQAKTITVVDYKTGKSYDRWENTAKLHKYKQQLHCYKLLIEGSHTFSGYTVTGARLEFIEADPQARTGSLELSFLEEELMRTKQLIAAMWQHVMRLNFPDTTRYDPNLTGIKQFESDLLDGTI